MFAARAAAVFAARAAAVFAREEARAAARAEARVPTSFSRVNFIIWSGNRHDVAVGVSRNGGYSVAPIVIWACFAYIKLIL